MVSIVIGSELSIARRPEAYENSSWPSLLTTYVTDPGIPVDGFAVAASIVERILDAAVELMIFDDMMGCSDLVVSSLSVSKRQFYIYICVCV